MSYKRRLIRGLAKDTTRAKPSPRKEEAKRYTADTAKRGPKLRGPATQCPHCLTEFFSRKAKARHIQLSHRRRLIGEEAEAVQAAD